MSFEEGIMKAIGVLELCMHNEVLHSLVEKCPIHILNKFTIVNFKKDEFYLKQGVIHEFVYIIIDGEVEIFYENKNDRLQYSETYKSGDLIGEIEIFENLKYANSVCSVSDVSLIRIDKSTFLEWVNLDNNFSVILLKRLSKNLWNSFYQFEMNTVYSLKDRLCRFLLENQNEIINTKDLPIKMMVTSRSINRILKELKEKDILSVEKGIIYIFNIDLLKKEIY